MSLSGPPLGILAGGGALPRRLTVACRAIGREVFVLAFEGQTDPETTADVNHAWVRLGAAGRALAHLRAAGVEELAFAGAIRRPSLAGLRPDARAARLLTRIGVRSLGDDGLLSAVIAELEEAEGFRVIAPDMIVAELLATPGAYGRLGPDAGAERDIARGVAVARGLGAFDVGQAVVVQDGIVLGLEAVEGTGALLERCAALGREGPGGVLVKVRKPGQERRVDLPTIGRETVVAAAAAGLRGIAVEAGGALVIDRAAVADAADRAGLFVVGIEVPV